MTPLRPNRNRPLPAGVYLPGPRTPVNPRPNVSANYGKDVEYIEKLFQLPQTAGAEITVFSTNDPHTAMDVMFAPRFDVVGGQTGDNIANFEFIFTIWAVSGQLRERVAQGRYTDIEHNSVSGAVLMSARSGAQHFEVTCEAVHPAKGQVAISAWAYGKSASTDPVQNAAPSGAILNRQWAGGSNIAGTVTSKRAQVFQFFGYSRGATTIYLAFYDGTRIMGELIVPPNANFSLNYTPALWFNENVNWVASATPGGPPDSVNALMSVYTQFR